VEGLRLTGTDFFTSQPVKSMATGLDLFKEFIADFRSVSGWAGKGAIAAPLADFVISIGPSWPRGMPIITALAELVVLICVFEYWSQSAREKQRRRMKLLLGLLIAMTGGYLALTSQFTFEHPKTKDLVVHGWQLRPEARALLRPGDTPYSLLSGAEYNTDRIWTHGSTTTMRLAVVSTWLLAFCSLAGLLAVFVVIQQDQTARAARRRSMRSVAVPADG
jgi:hypothetical protein